MEWLLNYSGSATNLVIIVLGMVMMKVIPRAIEKKMAKRDADYEKLAGVERDLNGMKEVFIYDLAQILEKLEGKIDAIPGEIRELDARLDYIDRNSFMAIIYNRHIHVIDRLCAFNGYLKLGENGVVSDYAVSNLVLPNWEDWLRVIHESSMKARCGKYDGNIEKIEKQWRKKNGL